MQTHFIPSSFSSSESWSILSDLERSIKAKIESVGIPLREWNIQINYGIKTGFNDAFIIDAAKRNEILVACQNENERLRTADIIRPILRGRDIKRYGYDWVDLWLIWVPWHFPFFKDDTILGASTEAENAFREQYPSVFNHLLQYKPQLEVRNKAETGIRYEWYALQRWGANYWDEFSKPKIVWGNLNTNGSYAMAPENMFINAPACMIVPGSHYLLTALNSKVADYYIRNLGVVRNGGFFEYKPMFVEQIPIPLPTSEIEASIESVLNSDAPEELKDNQLESIIESLFDFTEQEIAYLHNQ